MENIQPSESSIRESEQINELAAALCKAQGEFQSAIKDKANPYFKSKFADLNSIIEASRNALYNQGLAVIQMPQGDQRKVSVTTRLMHSSGQWIESTYGCTPPKTDPQAVGIIITYFRRYALAAFLGIRQEDDDANSVSYISAAQAMELEIMLKDHPEIRKKLKGGNIKKIPLERYHETIAWVKEQVEAKEAE